MSIDFFPDGTPVEKWFSETFSPCAEKSAKRYVATDYGVKDDGKLYTSQLQRLIDFVADNGGGVVVIPAGTYKTGALFFKQGVDLCIEKNGVLLGSDDISDYKLCKTRIEGETCEYFSALINADGLSGFTMFGEGVLDGNGMRSWKAFWLRRSWNPMCTNKDEQRPRLVYISNCTNVTVSGLTMRNSHFWTNHFYKCRYVRLVGCTVLSPSEPVGAPSTDAVDLDVCTDVLIKNCKFAVNDDAVALKGGKGPFADTAPENGANERIIIEDCEYGLCHSCLTCGSEAIHNRNIVLRNVKVNGAYRLLWLKMRTDTPQLYEYVTVENASGTVADFINIYSWNQFFDLKGRKDIPMSYADSITMKNCDIKCENYFSLSPESELYRLSNFTFENLNITASNNGYTENTVENMITNNVTVNTEN